MKKDCPAKFLSRKKQTLLSPLQPSPRQRFSQQSHWFCESAATSRGQENTRLQKAGNYELFFCDSELQLFLALTLQFLWTKPLHMGMAWVTN